MPLLARIEIPRDLRALGSADIRRLATEIREFLVAKVSLTGGHLGPNLGVVELTIALHRVFDSPRDPLFFDTGHQAYVHKILTGRRDGFDGLRARGGLSGYPSRAESEHDWTESSHASAALSYADGLAKAFALRGQRDRCVVAVVGDGALTGGMCWEALNNIAAGPPRPLVVLVNDNGRSYDPTVGRPAERMFLGTGLKYLGPIDGHDTAAVEAALAEAKSCRAPVIVHAVTEKGRGYRPAEADAGDRMHGPGPFDPATGRATTVAGASWTAEFSAELIRQAERRPDLVAVTAAMAAPTGLAAFGARFPERLFDVGIAEQHALTSAAGLALGGLHPVVALYSTFLNRGFDQLLMDVALLRLPVTLVLDRAGVTGPDGASHHGVWDLALLALVPGIRVAAPRDGSTLRAEFAAALAIKDGPSAVRFPKGAAGPDIPAVDRFGDIDALFIPGRGGDVLLIAIGSLADAAVAAARRATARGIQVTVVDPRWVLPISADLVSLAAGYRLVVTVEDGVQHGGIGSAIASALAAAGIAVPIRGIGVPGRFLEHGTRAELLEHIGLEPAAIEQRIVEWACQR
ncbi:1-deoxy-D-xylulose-5-phosphate synthase [Nocardia goodfellowii]